MKKEITMEQITQFEQEFTADSAHLIAQRSVTKNGILASAECLASTVVNTPVFSLDLTTGKVSDQKQSGRCWMFADLNTFLHQIANQFKLVDFELSQNYTFFWDKFEKANYFYENILTTAMEPVTSRKVAFLLQTPQQDVGQWDMLVALIEKYGVVPKAVMPETKSSSNSRELNGLLNKKLRKDAVQLRSSVAKGASEEEIAQLRQELLQEVYSILATSLGIPPTSFDFEYRDEEKNYHIERNLTPKTYYDKYVGLDLSEYVSLINAPTADKPFNRSYTVEMLGSVVGSRPVKYLNVDMTTLKQATIAQLASGESVWFGSDVGQASNSTLGIMATDLYDLKETFAVDFSMSKGERLDHGESLMTHAMVLTGVDLIDEQATKWKVENSWGEKVGNKGYFVMSDAWMDEYTYQVVIRKEFLSEELQSAFQQEPIILAPWDPMGALA